jgi:proteasome lid subunit RPN8/RPN11
MGKIDKLKRVIFMMAILVIILAILSVISVFNNYTSLSNVFIEENKIVMTDDVKDYLDEIYVGAEVEIPVCLAGRITDDEIIIDVAEETEIIQTNESAVAYIQCPNYIDAKKVVGTIHNHGNGVCRLSPADIDTYAGDLNRGQLVIGLYCDKYLFYLLSVIEPEVK